MTEPIFPLYLTAPWKRKYVEKKKNSHQCIFCAIANHIGQLDQWEVFRDEKVSVTLNKYPYNPGHLLVFPLNHYEEYETIPEELVHHISLIIQRSILMLKKIYKPSGFNIGLNLGSSSGASITHIHWHIVPRYAADLNFMEILGTRVLVETLEETYIKLTASKEKFQIK